jgi:hypothetical protein
MSWLLACLEVGIFEPLIFFAFKMGMETRKLRLAEVKKHRKQAQDDLYKNRSKCYKCYNYGGGI